MNLWKSFPKSLDLLSKYRAHTDASKPQLCMGKGKSCRTTGTLCLAAISQTMGNEREQSGDCRSSNITIATFAPRGGFRDDASAAKAQALKPSASSKIKTRLIDTLMK